MAGLQHLDWEIMSKETGCKRLLGGKARLVPLRSVGLLVDLAAGSGICT